MTKALVKIDAKATATRIVEALAGGLQAAADIYRDYVAQGGDPMELRRAAPVSADLWRTLDDVATGRIDVRALCLPGAVCRSVRLLPKVTQSSIIDKGVDVLATDGSSLKVRVNELTAVQAAQVFAHDGVRSPAQQAAWLKEQTTSHPLPPKTHVQFEVRRGKLVVYEPCELSMADLHRLLAQMG